MQRLNSRGAARALFEQHGRALVAASRLGGDCRALLPLAMADLPRDLYGKRARRNIRNNLQILVADALQEERREEAVRHAWRRIHPHFTRGLG